MPEHFSNHHATELALLLSPGHYGGQQQQFTRLKLLHIWMILNSEDSDRKNKSSTDVSAIGSLFCLW